jgi:UDP-GlcNAc3NAcA epimerase
MLKVATIVGARPQFVKAAVVSRQLRAIPDVHEVLIHTGQHYDDSMSQVFFDELQIPLPDFSLGIGSGPHGAQTGRMLSAIEEVLGRERPDWVLVYGDTNSTLAGALAAVKLHIPVAHVEAGVRSFNRRMPEEINRVLTDHAADLLFAPTATAIENLRREGIEDSKVALVGDVMYDAALYYAERANNKSSVLERLAVQKNGYALVTVHRAENTDDAIRLQAIIEAVHALSQTLPVIFPVHPRTRTVLREKYASLSTEKVLAIDPVGYLDMVMLEKNARLVATDSGGVQKEAFFYRVPCVTLRDETEWVETVDLGWNRVVPPTDKDSVTKNLFEALNALPGKEAFPYGEGRSSEKIAKLLTRSSKVASTTARGAD